MDLEVNEVLAWVREKYCLSSVLHFAFLRNAFCVLRNVFYVL